MLLSSVFAWCIDLCTLTPLPIWKKNATIITSFLSAVVLDSRPFRFLGLTSVYESGSPLVFLNHIRAVQSFPCICPALSLQLHKKKGLGESGI